MGILRVEGPPWGRRPRKAYPSSRSKTANSDRGPRRTTTSFRTHYNLPHLRSLRRNGGDFNSGNLYFLEKFKEFPIELTTQLSAFNLSYREAVARISYYGSLIVASKNLAKRDFPGTSRDLGIGYNQPKALSTKGFTCNFWIPVSNNNCHYLGARTHFGDKTFRSVIVSPIWKSYLNNEIKNLIIESLRISEKLILENEGDFHFPNLLKGFRIDEAQLIGLLRSLGKQYRYRVSSKSISIWGSEC